MFQGILLIGLLAALLACSCLYVRNMARWMRYLKTAGAEASSVGERKAVLASPEYQAVRRSVRLPLNLAAGCALVLYLVLQWR